MLRVVAFCTYLAAWVVFAIGAAIGALPALRRQAATAQNITAPTIIGALLQVASAMALTLSMPAGPLRPPPLHLAAVIVLAPLGAAVFVWSLRSAREGLVTTGAYALLRHPLYLAFLAMLLATGLLVTPLPRLAVALVIYLVGTELRIAEEERDLLDRHGDEFDQYRRRTRFRYLPGLR
ncbi:MAG: isoprenylcysteine carboxylmethyltransferase family protein [Bryobacterales bacterium]|nr:isoprenylcysteine carboxylmethyltransferase family protein [Bryobacterales bacterium]